MGVLGGTFNPPHRGHLELARSARAQLGLERVLLVPAHKAPFKSGRAGEEDPGPEHRLRMCELAARELGGVGVCAVEIARGGTSYTVDTLRELHASHPCAELTLILGADVAGRFSRWREPEQVRELASVAVAARPGTPAGEGLAHATLLQMAPVALSSSIIRRRVARGEPVGELVGDAVAGYIEEQGLYRARARAGR